jgi:hypothetical protein
MDAAKAHAMSPIERQQNLTQTCLKTRVDDT